MAVVLQLLSAIAILILVAVAIANPVVPITFLVIFLLFLLLQYIATRIARGIVLGNAVKVGPDQFPMIHEVKLEVMTRLDYQKNVEIYVIEEGYVNAFFSKFLGTQYMVLNSALVHSMDNPSSRAEMIWVVASVIGHFKAKHFRFWIARFLIAMEKLNPLLYLAYERMCHYTADHIAMVVCGDPQRAIQALVKFTVGHDLQDRVDLDPLQRQATEVDESLGAFLGSLASTHPHLLKRIKTLARHAGALTS